MTAHPPADIVVGPLSVGGATVLIRTNSDEFAAISRRVFAALVCADEPSPLRRIVEFETICHRRPELHWAIRRDGQDCEMQLADDAVIVHQQWELNRLVIEASRTAVHAAAVAVNGHAVLLAGPSYSGKTTLAGWLAARAGAGYMADEVASIDHLLRVRPYPRPLGLRQGGPLSTTGVVDPLVDPLVGRFMPDERLVPVGDLGAAVVGEATPVRLVVFPRYDAASPMSVRRLSQADTFERLAALTPGLVRHGRPVFERLALLAEATVAVELDYDDIGAAADQVIAELAAVEHNPTEHNDGAVL